MELTVDFHQDTQSKASVNTWGYNRKDPNSVESKSVITFHRFNLLSNANFKIEKLVTIPRPWKLYQAVIIFKRLDLLSNTCTCQDCTDSTDPKTLKSILICYNNQSFQFTEQYEFHDW